MSAGSRNRGGFTLIEVLVALIIVAVGIAAVMSSLISAASSTERLRDRAFAEWVAANRIVETRLDPTPPALGRSEGDAEMGGQKWRWRQEIAKTTVEGVVQIIVDVRPLAATDESNWMVTMRGARGEAVAVRGDADPVWDSARRTPP